MHGETRLSVAYVFDGLTSAHKKLKAQRVQLPHLCTLSRWQQRRLPKEACAPARKTKGKASKSTSIKIAEEEEEAGPEEVVPDSKKKKHDPLTGTLIKQHKPGAQAQQDGPICRHKAEEAQAEAR